MRKKQKDWAKDMAYQRIIRLFELARIEFGKNPEHSDRYVRLATKIAMRYRVRIPAEFRKQVCKHCCSYLVQGATARTRLRGTHISTTCTICGKQMRWPY